jgi:hypothetical protein
MIDLQNETALTLNEARRLPHLRGRGGNNISLCTIYRWATRGVGGAVLETAKVGGTVVTTAEAITRFIARLSDPRAVHTQPAKTRERAIAAADAVLDRAGIV